jgi:hypothetical protein
VRLSIKALLEEPMREEGEE